MSGERLAGSEKRALLMWVMLGIAGALFAQRYFFRAFPEASVDFRVSRDEALARAQRFVSGLGEDVSRYQSAIIFDVDDNAKTYLERELGLQQANRMMSSELNIWYWDVRFFKHSRKRNFTFASAPRERSPVTTTKWKSHARARRSIERLRKPRRKISSAANSELICTLGTFYRKK